MSPQPPDKTPPAEDRLPDPALVREQLRRLLAHPLFSNSKRYPALLAYVVEQALAGNSDNVKERTIGVEAFGREPSYDVSLDPVVRMAAAEVRKRLSQYYYAPQHAGELIVELPVGSYVPVFHEPTAAEAPPPEAAPAPSPRAASNISRRLGLAAAFLLIALAGFALGRLRLPATSSSLDRFWAPFTSSPNIITYCLAEPALLVSADPSRPLPAPGAKLHMADVITLARCLLPVVPSHQSFRVIAVSDTAFAQLREGPSVLIGAYDNPWTMRVTKDIPYSFAVEDSVRKIIHRSGKAWTRRPEGNLIKDYAVIARIQSQLTGQPLLILAGIGSAGTEAASEVISSRATLDAILRQAPANWDRSNIAILIETKVIDRLPGPPTTVGIEIW